MAGGREGPAGQEADSIHPHINSFRFPLQARQHVLKLEVKGSSPDLVADRLAE